MIPYADLLNHSNCPNTEWYFDDESDCFIVRSTTPILAGEEIFDTYGNKSNDILYMYYGFTISDNKNKISYPIIPLLTSNDRVQYLSKLRALQQNVKHVKNKDVAELYKEEIKHLQSILS